MIRVAYRRKMTPVDPDIPKVQDSLDFIWQSARLDEHEGDTSHATIIPDDLPGSRDKWVKLGLGSEHVRAEFARVGMLGLDCLVSTSTSTTCYYRLALMPCVASIRRPRF